MKKYLDGEEIERERETLNRVKELFKREETLELRIISNEMTEKAMMSQEPRLIEIALISYGLSKILQKPHYKKAEGWEKFKEEINQELSRSIEEKGKKLNRVLETIEKFNEEAGNYMKSVIHHARIKQASRLYALGTSLKTSAELTGAGEEELLSYIGETKISERTRPTVPVKERYERAKKVLED